jgi:hypothetical protein
MRVAANAAKSAVGKMKFWDQQAKVESTDTTNNRTKKG